MKQQTIVGFLIAAAIFFSAGYFVGAKHGPAGSNPFSTTAPAATQDGISLYFSPNGHCTAAIVAEIAAAKKEVLVQAFDFTSKPIAQALVDAHSRGVNVVAVLDKENVAKSDNNKTEAPVLSAASIPVFIDRKHTYAHNKIMLIDGQTIITGSFNFSENAELHNAENLLIIHDHPDLFSAYLENFQKHKDHSEPLP